MLPINSQDFQRAAAQRRAAAESLLDLRLNLDAQYLGGYAVECSLKALILSRTDDDVKDEKLHQITRGARMHYPYTLLGLLRDLGVGMPLALTKRMRKFQWTPDLR